MKDFRFLSYHTEYSVEGTINKPMGVEACFSFVFHHKGFMTNKYVIRVYDGLFQTKNGNNNACLLPLSLIEHHIKTIRRFWPFYYSISPKMNKDLHSFYEITVKLAAKDIIHKIILTWIRYLYEWPYNLYVIDLYKIKKLDEFKFCNPMNLFAMIMTCNNQGEDIHALTECYRFHKFTSYHKLLNKIEKKKDLLYVNIHDVYDNYVNIEEKQLDNRELNNIEWANDDAFQNRIKSYVKALEFLKKNKL